MPVDPHVITDPPVKDDTAGEYSASPSRPKTENGNGSGFSGHQNGNGSGSGGDSLARKAIARIEVLTKRFDDHTASDAAWMSRIESKLDRQGEQLGGLRESSAANAASLSAVLSELKHIRNLRAVEVQGEISNQLEMVKVDRTRISGRYKLAMAAVGAVGAGIGAVAKWIAGG